MSGLPSAVPQGKPSPHQRVNRRSQIRSEEESCPCRRRPHGVREPCCCSCSWPSWCPSGLCRLPRVDGRGRRQRRAHGLREDEPECLDAVPGGRGVGGVVAADPFVHTGPPLGLLDLYDSPVNFSGPSTIGPGTTGTLASRGSGHSFGIRFASPPRLARRSSSGNGRTMKLPARWEAS